LYLFDASPLLTVFLFNVMEKKQILDLARRQVEAVTQVIGQAQQKLLETIAHSHSDSRTLASGDQLIEERLREHHQRRLGELDHLAKSPYFVRCQVRLTGDNKLTDFYFAKFGFSEEAIYSWVVPASSLRFEEPGPVSYRRPDGLEQTGYLENKQQFMIVDGQIKFMAEESLGSSRQLIHQERLTNRTSGFVLPEIVAQMEKAQDQVIRADHQGPLVISGPAGSGKTTLALHRIAYLAQVPDLAEYYNSDSLLVLVQDQGTRNYFAALLPELGIDNVTVTTFADWALDLLGFKANYGYLEQPRNSDWYRYLYVKLEVLSQLAIADFNLKAPWLSLKKLYQKYFSQEQLAWFERQVEQQLLDRIDLTILLQIQQQQAGRLGKVDDYYIELKNGQLKKQRGFVPVNYSLILVDEFQNYLPAQLKLIRSCVDQKLASMIYVGDLAQQVELATIKDFTVIGEEIKADRRVVLQKVYRNTQEILKYVQKQGYDVDIPVDLKIGQPVQEWLGLSLQELPSKITDFLTNRDDNSVGLLFLSSVDLAKVSKSFSQYPKVHLMTWQQAQGVEFDLVFLIDSLHKELGLSDLSLEQLEELAKIKKDLYYVALTRAIQEMIVIKIG